MSGRTESYLIGVDFAENGDIGVLVVGKKRPNQSVEIVNAFQGKEAEELYEKLVKCPTKKVDTTALAI